MNAAELVDELSPSLRKAKGISDLAMSARGPDTDAFRAAAWAVSDLIADAEEALTKSAGAHA